MTALLHCHELRVDFGGAALFDGLSCSSTSDRLGLLGAWEPLLYVLAQRSRVVSGRLEVHGLDAGLAVGAGTVGLALYDPALPLRWTATRYLEQGAALTGLSRGESRNAARAVLERLGLTSIGQRRIATLVRAERRALCIAQATLQNPPVLVAQSPLAGLDDAAQRYVAQVLERAELGRRVIVTLGSVVNAGPEQNQLDSLQELWTLEAGLVLKSNPQQLASNGAPSSPVRRYVITASQHARALYRLLENRGFDLCAAPAAGGLAGPTSANEIAPHEHAPDGALRFVATLGADASLDGILDAALETSAPIIELIPLSLPATTGKQGT